MIRLEWILQQNITIDIQLRIGKRPKHKHFYVSKAIEFYQLQEILKICDTEHINLLNDENGDWWER